MIAALGLLIGIIAGLVFAPDVPLGLQQYLPIAVVAALDAVFGALALTDEAFTERSPYAPSSPYSASKAAADHFARAWHVTFGLPVVRLRVRAPVR